MKNTEVELRSFISKEEYEKFLDFFKKNSKFVKEDSQETHYLKTNGDLRIQRNDFGSKIWMKEGKIHDEARKEIEVKFGKGDFENVRDIFEKIGIGTEIKWLRKRYEFLWEGVKVSLDYTKGYGYIIEMEIMSDDSKKESVLNILKEKMSKLKIKLTSREEFDKAYNNYKINWRKLIEK